MGIGRLRSERWLKALVELVGSVTDGDDDKIVMVEVGSYAGESAGGFLSSGRIKHIYCVDPWKAGYDDEHDTSSHSDFTEVEAAFDGRHGDNPLVTKVKGDISVFADMYERGEFGDIKIDMVYIDACHTYEAVRSDISVAMSRIKPVRALAGHDYTWSGVKSGVISMLGDPQITFADTSWLIRTDGRRPNVAKQDKTKSAIVWASDGGDYKYLKYSAASMRMKVTHPCDFIVLAAADADLHDVDRTYGLIRIDPMPYMEPLGISKDKYDSLGKQWPFPALYRLAIPLISRFAQYKNVLYVDSDVLAVPDSQRSPDELLEYPMGEYEVAGAPDLYVDPSRNTTLIRDAIPEEMRSELSARVWSKFGNASKTFVNDGVLLWNVSAIEPFWYMLRCRAFSQIMHKLTFPDNDFVNVMMGMDDSLSTIFNSSFIGGGPYATGKACLRHYTAIAKSNMLRTGRRVPDITQDARFEQYACIPRDGSRKHDFSGKRCIVWCCDGRADYLRRLEYAVSALKAACEEDIAGTDLFILYDGKAPDRVTSMGIKTIDISGVLDASGLRTLSHDNWRGGWIYWDTSLATRFIVPFVDELAGYSSILYMNSGTFVIDKKFLDLFKLDLTGYDCAMVGDFSNKYAIYTEVKQLGFCKWFVRESVESPDSDYILGRMNAGIYFNSDVYLANAAEIRATLRDIPTVRDRVYDMIGSGSPDVAHDLFNCFCRILRVSGAYNSTGNTHYPGDPVYCINDKSTADDYPHLSRTSFI